jgi:membrane protein implicated in regulation of membrane protease activity
MDWSDATAWWIATGVLVAVELATGTFYLLMIAIGTAAGALGAHAGLSFTLQLVAAAAFGGGAVVAWHARRKRQPAAAPAAANRDVNLDVGERVNVERWEPDGSSRISYRGSAWNVRYAGEGHPRPGPHVIRAVEGNRLLLDRLPA